jgi:predicted nucleotidyltransferase
MSEIDDYLLTLARRNAEAYIAHTRPSAILLTGSAAHGECDRYSDVDMIVYYEALPSDDQLLAAWQAMPDVATRRPISRGARMIGESYSVHGVECQVGHALVADWEEEMSTVLEGLDVDSIKQKKLMGLAEGVSLHGEALIRRWQARAADYPEPLARALVEHYLRQIFPVWYFEERLARRDATLWVYQALVEASQGVLGVLAGLNRLYFSPIQFKRLHHYVGQMRVAPEDLAGRLDRLFAVEQTVAIAQIEAIVRDTIALVSRHMPGADLSGLPFRPGERDQPWSLAPF